MFLREVPEVKVVLTPAFLSVARNWGAISGTYVMQAKSLSSSLEMLKKRKGNSSKRDFVRASVAAWTHFSL